MSKITRTFSKHYYIHIGSNDKILDIFKKLINTTNTEIFALYGNNIIIINQISNIFKEYDLFFKEYKTGTIDIESKEFFKIDWKDTNVFKSLSGINKYNL